MSRLRRSAMFAAVCLCLTGLAALASPAIASADKILAYLRETVSENRIDRSAIFPVTGNTVSVGALGSHGIVVQSRITSTLCAEIASNVSTTGGAGLFGINVRQRDTSIFRLPVFSEDPLPNLVEFLASKQLLILLDNCEHVVESAARVAEAVLRRCPGVRLLATSREPLRAEGEWVHRLPPLERDAILDLVRPSVLVDGTFEIPTGIDDGPLPDIVAPAWKAPTSGGSTGRPKVVVDGRLGVTVRGLVGNAQDLLDGRQRLIRRVRQLLRVVRHVGRRLTRY